MNMLLHGYPDARIEKGDAIRDPKLLEGGELMLFDRVIANPPFSLDAWGQETASGDAHGRFRFGVPPKTKGDLAFVQHMVATLNAHGKMGVVMPHGVLFRGASEGEIRKGLLQEDLIEAVVGLPTNLFYGTGIPAAILVHQPRQAEGAQGQGAVRRGLARVPRGQRAELPARPGREEDRGRRRTPSRMWTSTRASLTSPRSRRTTGT